MTLITGYGWDTYVYMPEFNLAPHNTYLKIFFELGLIGVGLVFMALVNVLRAARAGIKFADDATRTMLIAFTFGFLCLMVAIFFVDLTTPWLFIWAYTGAAMRLARSQVVDQAPATAQGAGHDQAGATVQPTGSPAELMWSSGLHISSRVSGSAVPRNISSVS